MPAAAASAPIASCSAVGVGRRARASRRAPRPADRRRGRCASDRTAAAAEVGLELYASLMTVTPSAVRTSSMRSDAPLASRRPATTVVERRAEPRARRRPPSLRSRPGARHGGRASPARSPRTSRGRTGGAARRRARRRRSGRPRRRRARRAGPARRCERQEPADASHVAFRTASPSPGSASSSSPFTLAMPSRPPRCSACAIPMCVTTPMAGRAIAARSAMFPAKPRAHLGHDDLGGVRRAEQREWEPRLVVVRRGARVHPSRSPRVRRPSGPSSRSCRPSP